jgi:hypothetical protein
MADLVAGAARHAIVGRQPYAGWYRLHLDGRARSMGRGVDVSRHALARLRTLAPDDACASGWPDARLALRADVQQLAIA